MKISSRRFYKGDIKPNLEREDLIKKKFKAYQLIEYIPYGKDLETYEPVECMLVAVDFDKELFVLRPFPTETRLIDNDDFHVHISQCRIVPYKIKVNESFNN